MPLDVSGRLFEEFVGLGFLHDLVSPLELEGLHRVLFLLLSFFESFFELLDISGDVFLGLGQVFDFGFGFLMPLEDFLAGLLGLLLELFLLFDDALELGEEFAVLPDRSVALQQFFQLCDDDRDFGVGGIEVALDLFEELAGVSEKLGGVQHVFVIDSVKRIPETNEVRAACFLHQAIGLERLDKFFEPIDDHVHALVDQELALLFHHDAVGFLEELFPVFCGS